MSQSRQHDKSELYEYVVMNSKKLEGESQKSPTTVLFDVDTGKISIRHCEILKSISLNVLARSDDNA
ncbi:hypothetical protein Tco_0957480 [Tanacetum coccineum]